MRVLAVGAHPDDLEISCGGTLAKLRDAGHELHLCHATLGDKGHYDLPADELRRIRSDEARAAGAVLGADVTSLGLSDGAVDAADEDVRRRCIALVQAFRPDLVITHAPNDYMPDHVAVSRLVFDTTFLATLPGYGTEHAPLARPPALFYMDNLTGIGFEPTLYVDVTETLATKLAMLREHRSQLEWLREHDDVDIEELVSTMARSRGLQAGCRYAEGFVQHLVWTRPNTLRMPV